MSPRVAFLSMASLEGFACYDELAAQALRSRGARVDTVPWRSPDTDWTRYDVVVVRSPWDYQQDAPAFLDTLARIEAAAGRLENPLAVMRWNLDKRYLGDLAQRGVATLPTRFLATYDAQAVAAAFAEFGCRELILKPAISANADHTWRLDADGLHQHGAELARVFAARPHLLQAFEPSVLDPGEFSLFHFNGAYSHAIRKRPKPGDFRVQEEHGGEITAVTPEPALRDAAERALAAIGSELLYARTDFVRHAGGWCLMEAELIEPSLYFQTDSAAADRFADALLARCRGDRPQAADPARRRTCA